MLLQVLITFKILTANEISGIKSKYKSIEKYRKLTKIGKLSEGLKLSKLGNSKVEKISKSQKSAKLEKKLLKIGIYLILTLKKTGQTF